MYRTIALFLGMTAAALCAGKTYHFTLYSNATIGGAELKPGDYKLVVDQDTMTVQGVPTSKTAIKTETAKQKFDQTSVRLSNADGKSRIQEIRIGGTTTRLVISEPASNAGQ